MHKFSSRTMLIFVVGLLVAVILLGLGTAYMSKLKQQRRQLSDSSLYQLRSAGAAAGRITRRPDGTDNLSVNRLRA